jgi:hypothetical protein
MKSGAILCLGAALAVAPLGRGTAPDARPDAQTCITVVGMDDRPVTGLAAEDFSMRDAAVKLPVVDVQPATAPIVRHQAGADTVTGAPRLADALCGGRVALWTIEIGASAQGMDRILADATSIGGALRLTAASAADLPRAATRLADLLLSQYVVTFEWPIPC